LVMRALQFRAFGDPAAQLVLMDLPDPQPREGWAIVRVHAASVNPSDVGNVAGQMEGTMLPRVPGRDFSGVVEAGPPDWIGAEVWGTGGDAGFTLDGSHAELIAIPEAALARKPATLDYPQAASIGVTFAVGWMGLADYASLKKGEDVAIVGVSGGVGGAVAQLARALGARRVVGIPRCSYGQLRSNANDKLTTGDMRASPLTIRASILVLEQIKIASSHRSCQILWYIASLGLRIAGVCRWKAFRLVHY
jgi:NADPH:quinone reductase